MFRVTSIASFMLCLLAICQGTNAASPRPNIVFVLCDDLGYGDVQCLNLEHGKIATPSVDKLAAAGMVFTDAHAGSSVCTPTRYGLMTGRYSWRTELQSGVVQGFAPDLVAEDRPTVASFLKSQGYHTGIVGKWHLNFQYLDPVTGTALNRKDGLAPVGSRIPDGPIHRGFDFFHGFHHARNMKCVVENDQVIEHDDEINMLPRLEREAVNYIGARAADSAQTPFFLYVPFGSPHTPIVPSKAWQGKSGLGDYADFVMQTDAAVGKIADALQQAGLAENTMFVFSSDNGCSRAAGIAQLAKLGHQVSAGYRGSKADLWDGGHRIPFIVRWPGQVAAGSTCDQTICLTDLFATLSELTGETLPAGSAEDSVSFLPALSGEPIASTRDGVIHHSISGHFGYRQGKWKLLLAKGSGGWSSPTEKQVAADSPIAQLYDMESDPAETTNQYASQPEVAARLIALLKADIARGRSTTGPESRNDTDNIKLWKSGTQR
ncbi:sulfatase family protein [Allorhodopirellula heiligendammensis]|uniref:Arylsulfatase n=1 Tax=Allorhodopirellula heiligendammensis TaxID=2714739 RepID=A0A5C6C0I6_9BACT|nr:arylsulfatase [Allorhodopirellula heiligendammensis]TWU18050.1 Arylsulfatase precursor [Allorhodopirellula heiligendammensis]